jgi:hypothetical protein
MAVAIGCSQEPSVPKLGNDPVTVTLSLSTRSMKAGSPDTIRATVTNTLEQSVRLTFPGQCQVFVTVRNSTGDIVAPRDGRPECLPLASALTLSAMGTRVFTTIWTGGYSFAPPDTPEKVPPGAYFISAELIASGYSTFAPPFKVDVVP